MSKQIVVDGNAVDVGTVPVVGENVAVGTVVVIDVVVIETVVDVVAAAAAVQRKQDILMGPCGP